MSDGYQCPACGGRSLITGYCPECIKRRRYVRVKPTEAGVVPMHAIPGDDVRRLAILGWSSVENALCGGFPVGSVTAFYGAPGVGKTTLALQLADAVGQVTVPSGSWPLSRSLYVTTELSAVLLKSFALRIGLAESAVGVLATTYVEEMERLLERISPAFLVVDSLQELHVSETDVGHEIVEVTRRIVALCRERNMAALVVLHANADDDYAGPRTIEHLVDTMVVLESREGYPDNVIWRIVGKNRFGAVGRNAVLARRPDGGFKA